jgi:signal transduction histidine kinase
MQSFVKSQLRRSPARAASFRRKFIAPQPTDSKAKEPLTAIAHDTRNVVAALSLFCDLLAEPGVLSEGNQHLARELQAVASASSGLVEQLTALGLPSHARKQSRVRNVTKSAVRVSHIDDLAAAVEHLKGPLAALVGTKIELQMECLSCAGRVSLSHEGLTRILVNLTRNAAEAMPHGGRIRITVQLSDGGSFLDTTDPSRTVLLCVQDSGPGIRQDQIKRLFDAGFTTKKHGPHRGLGLNIVRRLAESAGGSVRALSAPGGGARFEVELPLIHSIRTNSGFPADFMQGANLEC